MARVLVIDDEEMIRWSIQQTLSAAGHEVTACGTAAEGMAVFEWLQPDVVLLDLRLPDANGATILKAIKAENSRETKVIVMTAFEQDCTAERAKDLGAFEYLKKPFDFDELATIVSRALETHLRVELLTAAQEGVRGTPTVPISRPKS
jgi:two-component system, NtrC family, response regulator AtoC